MTSYSQFSLETRKEGMYDITGRVVQVIADSNIQNGICVLHCPHTTAGLTINENADSDVTRDMLYALGEISPDRPGFRHMEGNSPAHIKASLMGSSLTLIVRGGRPVLGTWQGVYFCEFDGPRRRSVHVQVMGE